MNFFDKFQNGLEKVVGPFATAVGKSKYIQALTEGFMYSWEELIIVTIQGLGFLR